MPFTIAANAKADFDLVIHTGRPGAMSQDVHLFLDEQSVLKQIDIPFEANAVE